MYIKVDLTLQAQDTSYFLQCLHCEVSIQSQRGYVVVTYRSPSQYNLKFKSYLSNFERFFEHINRLNLSFQQLLDTSMLDHGSQMIQHQWKVLSQIYNDFIIIHTVRDSRDLCVYHSIVKQEEMVLFSCSLVLLAG